MPVFLVSFRLAYDANYQQRYESVIARVRAISHGAIWEETSSFFVFQAAGDASSVAHDLHFSTLMSGVGDVLFVLDLSTRQYSTYGAKEHEVLRSIMGG